MSLFILDTDTISNFFRRHSSLREAVARNRDHKLVVTIITVDEMWSGWATALGRARTAAQLAAIYERKTETLNDLRDWAILTYSEPAIQRFEVLKRQKLNVQANDMKIAAIALEAGAVVVTHNVRDFNRIPGLRVEDWC